MPPPEPIDKQHRWIWPFELLERIGEGGMGEVYRARFVKNDRIVAVKLLPADVVNDTILARFDREMKILRSLRHPNIVHCFGGATEGDRQFYAMELVEGGTLSDLLRKQGRLSADRTIEFARQMCDGLAYAHERGVVHRDVKPGNFLVTPDGRLKLSDFGLATIAAGRKITAHDRTVGTFLYMAPEQITGKPAVSPQTDLYALGCVLFELLTGSPPFQGETSGEVLHKHLDQPAPRVASLVPSCPAELDQLIVKLLEKKPEDRPGSAKEVAAALHDCANSVTLVERRPSFLMPTPAAENTVAQASPLVSPPTTGRSSPPDRSPVAGDARRTRGVPIWLFAACMILLVALLVWNRSLARRAAAFERAEATLIEAFRGEDQPARLAAAGALAEFATESEPALRALIAGLNDDDPLFRRAVAEALGRTGAAGLPARADLARVQKLDDRPMVRSAAGEALAKIEAAPRETRRWPWIVAAVTAAAVAGFVWLRRRLRAIAATMESPRRV